jgi:hypothetical protein
LGLAVVATSWHSASAMLAAILNTGAVILCQWHSSSAHLEEIARSTPISAHVVSLRFSLDGTRLQVLTNHNTDYILDATTIQPASPPACAWSDPSDTSPDGVWRAEIRNGRLEIVAVGDGVGGS